MTIYGNANPTGLLREPPTIIYLMVSLLDPMSLLLYKIPLEPHHNHNFKINSRVMVLEFCIDIL
jgi:hypothetical protein